MKILIADDSFIARKGIRTMLSGIEADFLEAKNGEEAYNVIMNINPDCVLLDLLMPVMTGIETLKKLDDTVLNSKIIVISADIQATTRELCKSLGVIHFHNKPPLKDDLLKSIQMVTKSDNK